MAASNKPREWHVWNDGRRLVISEEIQRVASLGCYLLSPDDEDWANANLIAAAPELLEALRALVPSDEQQQGWWCRHCVAETGATYDERCTSCGEPFGEPVEEAEAVRVARAAIAKAEGHA